jgi:hypothetical protein
MSYSVLFQPTKAFEDAFHNPNVKGALVIVLLTGLLTSLAVYLISGNLLTTLSSFIVSIVQWLVFAIFIWFFEFIHIRKKKRLLGVTYSQCLSVVGKLWTINFLGAIVFVVTAFFSPMVNSTLLLFLGVVLILSSVILTIAWILASFKMLKVVFGVEGGKLLINWLIISILNGLTIGVFTTLLSRLFF